MRSYFAITVGVGGVSPGEAQVTVTATNEDDQSAETMFSVLVPNRAPNFVSDMTEADVAVNKSVEWNLAELFEEPDREEMTFEATSSNSAVGVAVDGSIAEVFALSEGQSQVTLTATDPHGSKGTGTVNVTVKTPVLVWEDDFETDASLDDWAADDASKIWVEDGSLHVQTLEDDRYGIAERDADDVKDFEFAFTSLTPDGGQSGLIWLTGETTGDEAYRFLMGGGGGKETGFLTGSRGRLGLTWLTGLRTSLNTTKCRTSPSRSATAISGPL